jgi:hypothetical protein
MSELVINGPRAASELGPLILGQRTRSDYFSMSFSCQTGTLRASSHRCCWLRLQPVEINQSDKVIFYRLGKLLRKTDIRQAQLRRFGVCLSQLIPHARFEGIEPQSEGRQLKLEIIHFLR